MPRVALLALAVGLVLADSSVVTLGLPDVLTDFDVSPNAVSWVLTAYNLVLALAAVPAALVVTRSSPRRVATAGLLVFAVASLVAALAPSLGVLIAARCLQGLGGAAVACAVLVELEVAAGGRARGAAVWGAAGALGAAVGPALGGLLTETFAWQAIFAVQVPLALVCIPAARTGPEHMVAEPPGERRPDTPDLVAIACLGAGLTAALFLLVLLLIAGWRETPLAAAATVTVMPAAALLATRVRLADVRTRGAAGTILVAGGLAALGLLPHAGIPWTFAPQILVGFGLGLALGPLTEAALHDRTPLVLHGGWTITARHVGVVAALAILTPIFTHDLTREEDRAKESVLAVLLDSPISPSTKIDLSLALVRQLNGAHGSVPDIAPAFRSAAPPDPAERERLAALERDVDEQLDRAATAAFKRSFLIASALSALALLPLLFAPRGRPRPDPERAPDPEPDPEPPARSLWEPAA